MKTFTTIMCPSFSVIYGFVSLDLDDRAIVWITIRDVNGLTSKFYIKTSDFEAIDLAFSHDAPHHYEALYSFFSYDFDVLINEFYYFQNL